MEPTDETSALKLLTSLYKELMDRSATTRRFDDYYEGKHNLVFATEQFRETFGGLFREFADNWCEVVVNAPHERLTVTGFRLADGVGGDSVVWDIWQRNQMDAESSMGLQEALIHGVAYGLVWPGQDVPRITIEHPDQMIVRCAAGSSHRRTAALKVWVGDDEHRYATLYTQRHLWKFRSTTKHPETMPAVAESTWKRREVRDEAWPLPNPLAPFVPVVPLPNRPRLLTGGRSELRSVVPVQDAVNKLVTDMMVAAEFSAMRQRWATGMEIPVDPETDQPLEAFSEALKRRLWTVDEPTAQFGEFSQTDLGNYVKAVNMLVQHLASQTRTPPHYFYLGNEFPSADSMKPAEAGLVAKARTAMLSFGEGFEELIRLALTAADDPRRGDGRIETIWSDPETRTEAELVDSLIKKKELGVPLRQLWEDAGYSDTTIARFDEMRRQEAALAATASLGDILAEPMIDAPQPAEP